jgi:glycosyltransferase EpsD
MSKMKKVLFVASVASHFESFHTPYFKWFKQQGYEVHAAALDNGCLPLEGCDKFINIPFERSPYSKGNFRAYKMLKETLANGNYDIVHCHTPMAAALTRLAARKLRKDGLKVIYTAHGFHFFKGAPKLGWLIYYPVEKILSRYTDALITINREDFEATKKYNFKCGCSYLVPGVGVNTSKFFPTSNTIREQLRKESQISTDAFTLFYAAEFIPRKNHQFIIHALSELVQSIPNLVVIFAGDGPLLDEMKSLSQHLGVDSHIKFLGYRHDIPNIVALSDLGISSSHQEGLPINVAEYMSVGLPVVVSIERGHKEMVEDGVNGFLYDLSNPQQFINRIIELYNDPSLRTRIGDAARESIQKFSIENALAAHAKIYEQYM